MALRITGSVIGEPITSSSTSATGMWTSQEVAALQKDGIWQIAPTFTLTPSAATVNEGASITVTLTTTGIPNGAVVPYVITGANVSANDSANGILTGNFVIQNGSNTISFSANADSTLEGAETLTIRAGTASANVTINDTSRGQDAQFNYTTLLLNGDGTNNTQNNTFLDSSTNTFTITRNGNPTQGSFSPYKPGFSVLINPTQGNAGYVLPADTAGLNSVAGDFTYEVWAMRTQISSLMVISMCSHDTTASMVRMSSDGSMGAGPFSVSSAEANGLVFAAPNRWFHMAISRQSGTSYLHIDGVQIKSAADATAYSFSGGASNYVALIGTYNNNANQEWVGYMSNFRIVTGRAIYALGSTFTPSTEPLTAVSGTNLLLFTGPTITDKSSNNVSLTLGGTTLPSVTPFSPCSPTTAYTPSLYGGSAYFDGTGDYLELPPNSANFLHTCTAPWTIESWFYTSSTSAQAIFSTDADSVSVGINISLSNTVSRNIDVQIFRGSSGNFYRFYTGAAWNVNAWNHFAVTYNGSTFSIYVNGVSQSLTISGTATFSASNATYYPAIGVYKSGSGLGNYVTGWISNLRLVNGSAVYTSAFTPPTAPVTAISGTSLLCNFTNAGIYDSTMINNLETVANSKISTTDSKFGGSSMFFDGTGDYLTVPYNPSFNLGTGNFTIEFWVNTSSTTAYASALRLGDTWTTGSWALYLNDSNGNGYPSWWSYTLNNALSTSGALVNNGAWHHIALVRSTTTMTMYIDGISKGTLSVSTSSVGDTTTKLWIARDSSNVRELAGYIDDLRITRGYARYTSTFTPPTRTLPGF